MATRSVNGLLTSVDSLFTTQQERDEANLKKIYDIPISEIDDFPEHSYQVNDDEDMDRLVESIKERGIIRWGHKQNCILQSHRDDNRFYIFLPIYHLFFCVYSLRALPCGSTPFVYNKQCDHLF